MRCSLALLGVTFLFGARLNGQSPPKIDPSVENLVTGGTWHAGATTGRFRVIEVTQGWEEVRHRVFVQWMAEPQERGQATVRATVDLTSTAQTYSLAEPKLSERGGHWFVTVRGAPAPLEAFTESFTFDLGQPGKVAADSHSVNWRTG